MPACSKRTSAILLCLLTAFFPGAASSQNAPQPQGSQEPSPLLAAYDFEEPTPSGPDTFWLRERGGSVNLSTAYRVSGERSLHLREVDGDRDFSEFLVYFDERREGAVFVQLYLLLTDPHQTFNLGLAGRSWFLSREAEGQAIWLQSSEGFLRHRPADEWEELFAPEPYVWYFLDLVYDVERGSYDLAIYEEGRQEPVVDVRRQASMNGHAPSAVRYLSLIGDLEDEDRFDYFVDDLLVASDPAVLQKPFVAPGRRSFFVDLYSPVPLKLDAAKQQSLLDEARSALMALRPDVETASATLTSIEQAGDVAFRSRDLELAEWIYGTLSEFPGYEGRMLLKLADVAHLRGDVERERALREAIYGRLDVE